MNTHAPGPAAQSNLDFLTSAGLTGKEIAAHDWARTSLGPPAAWPASLRTILGVMLFAKQAQLLMWGPELITFYNDGYRPVMGSLPSGIGRSYPAFRPDIWPAIQPMVDVVRTGESFFFNDREMVVRRYGEDEKVAFSCAYSPVFGDNGQVSGVLASLVETTEQVRSRARLEAENRRFRDLFRNAPSFLAVLKGPAHEFEFANQAYLALVGDRPILGKPVRDALPDLAGQGFYALLDRVYATGEPYVGRDTRVVLQRKGEQADTLFVDFIYQPILEEDGAVTGILVDGFDVTERHNARSKAEALQMELVQATRVSAMVTMASSLAHELNQPLAAAKAYLSGASILLRGNPDIDPDIGTAMNSAADQITRAGDIIRRIRAMVSQRPARPKPVDLHGCIDNALKLVRTSGACEGVTVQVNVRDAELMAAAEDIQIEQVLVNLIRNGCQAAAGSDKQVVTLTARRTKRLVTIEVTDSGPGIPDEIVSGQFDLSDSGQGEGIGLGLSICRTMIEAFNGTFYARNKPGGAMFGFTLPAAS